MHSKKGNFYGILLLLLIIVALVGLFTLKGPTGFAVKATACFEGTPSGECSLVKSKYCDNGALKNNCQKCGCNKDEVCQPDGNCLQKCADGTLFGYCSENKPLLCFKGSLLENCFECGCFTGQTCLQNGTCSGNIEVGAGVEEKKEVEEEKVVEDNKITGKCSDGTLYGACSALKPNYCDNGNLVDNCNICGCEQDGVCSNGKCLKETPKKAGFWRNLFCKVFYSNNYNDCISNVVK